MAEDVVGEGVDDEVGEEDVALVEDGSVVAVPDGLVHEGVRANEVEHRVGEGGRVVDALAGPGFGDPVRQDGEPRRAGRRLLLELPGEGPVDVLQGERADRRAHEPGRRGREHSVEQLVLARHLVDRLDFIKVEGKFSGDGAVEPGLEIGGPVLAEDVFAPGVSFADSGHSREDAFAAVDVLDGRLSEEEQDVLPHVVRSNEVRFVEPLGVVFEGSLVGELAFHGGEVEELRAEDDGVGLGELGVGARVEAGQVARIPALHPGRRRVVRRVVRALGDPVPHARDVLVPR